MADYSRTLALATAVALEAGGMLRAEFHRSGGPRGQGSHADIDAETETHIRARLLAEFPWGFRGEELGYVPGANDPHLWLVDPHDGTSAFLQGRRGSAVSIGLLRDGVPVLGVVYAFGYPDDHGDLICWAEGCGPITRNGQVVAAVPKKTRQGSSADRLPIVMLWAGADTNASAALRCVEPARYIAMPSIAYRLALAAVGDAVAAASINGPLGWDYAAGHALVRAAGGVFVNQRGDPITYSPDGQSYAVRCFGGDAATATTLWPRDWSAVFSSAGRVTRASFSLAKPERGAAVSDPDRLARAQGCLLGQLIGDSLGGQVEFRSAESLRAAYPAGVREMVDGGTWNILAGQPTDDSELALILARTLVRERAYDPRVVLQSYLYWYLSRPFDVGSTIGAALEAAGHGKSEDERLQLALQHASHGSQANGSLMRISPLGIFAAGSPEAGIRCARADSRLTHPHPVCQDACAVYTAALAHAVAEGGLPRQCFRAALDLAERLGVRAEVKQALAAAEHGPPEDYQRHQGWVLIALRNAFFQLLHAPNLEEGLVATVMAGGDTDTNAAIAGALLGAVYGHRALPPRWVQAVLSCRPLRRTQTAHPRPTEFWPVDALELAEALLLGGEQSRSAIPC